MVTVPVEGDGFAVGLMLAVMSCVDQVPVAWSRETSTRSPVGARPNTLMSPSGSANGVGQLVVNSGTFEPVAVMSVVARDYKKCSCLFRHSLTS